MPNDMFGATIAGMERDATSISVRVCRDKAVVPKSTAARCFSAMRTALRAPSSDEKSMTASMGALALLAASVGFGVALEIDLGYKFEPWVVVCERTGSRTHATGGTVNGESNHGRFPLRGWRGAAKSVKIRSSRVR
jgi:hypothetical protein